MAKANVNTVSRDQLVEAGIRTDLADEILKLRRKEKITSLEALNQLPGIGPFTHAQLRNLLDFTDQVEEPTREAEAVRLAAGVAGVVAHQAAESTTELGRALTDLMQEQIEHNFQTWTALTSATDWGQVFQIQREFLRVSLERAAQLTQRCLEAARAGMIAAASATPNQARNAA